MPLKKFGQPKKKKDESEDSGKEDNPDAEPEYIDAETMLKKRRTAPSLRKHKLFDEYTVGKVMGMGNLGEVRRCQHKKTLAHRCVKLFSKRLCKK